MSDGKGSHSTPSPEKHVRLATRWTGGGVGGGSDLPWPETVSGLGPGETVVLRAFRYWVVGVGDGHPGQLSLAWNELASALGPVRGRRALGALTGLIRELAHARRRLRHHQPCCSCLTGDEIAILGFVGACRRREWTLARGLAEWLVVADGVAGLLECGARLGGALAEAGFEAPPRHRSPPPRASAPEVTADRASR